MNIQKLDGHYDLYPLHITLDTYYDHRGCFFETWRNNNDFDFIRPVQSNVSVSSLGTFRGLHFQVGTPQAKLLTVLSGLIIDYWVDVRPFSPTFSKFAFVPLMQGESIFIPKGFAHGFLSLSDNTIVNYLVDEYRVVENERVINAFDESLKPVIGQADMKSEIIETMSLYGINFDDMKVSEKDKNARFLKEFSNCEL